MFPGRMHTPGPQGALCRARQGLLENYTGFSAAIITLPVNPDLIIDTQLLTLESSTQQILDFLERHRLFQL